MTIELKVPNMACFRTHRAYGACGKTITKAVYEIDPKAEVQTDLKTKQVIVESNASESLREAIAAGYPPA